MTWQNRVALCYICFELFLHILIKLVRVDIHVLFIFDRSELVRDGRKHTNAIVTYQVGLQYFSYTKVLCVTRSAFQTSCSSVNKNRH